MPCKGHQPTRPFVDALVIGIYSNRFDMEDVVFTFLFHGFEVLVQPRRSFPGYQLSLLFRLLRICHYTQKTQKITWGGDAPHQTAGSMLKPSPICLTPT